jgi:hypothetical protein
VIIIDEGGEVLGYDVSHAQYNRTEIRVQIRAIIPGGLDISLHYPCFKDTILITIRLDIEIWWFSAITPTRLPNNAVGASNCL